MRPACLRVWLSAGYSSGVVRPSPGLFLAANVRRARLFPRRCVLGIGGMFRVRAWEIRLGGPSARFWLGAATWKTKEACSYVDCFLCLRPFAPPFGCYRELNSSGVRIPNRYQAEGNDPAVSEKNRGKLYSYNGRSAAGKEVREGELGRGLAGGRC